jgi:hypothetical protein
MGGIEQAAEYLGVGLGQFPEGSLRTALVALVGSIFMWSGLAKARSPWATAYALVDFRLVGRPHIPLAWMVIVGELGLSILLLIAPAISSQLTALAASVAACTCFIFAALVVRALRTERRFECACFGGDGEEITRSTLVRSAMIAFVALSCAVAGPFGPPLAVEELALTWCAGAATLGIGVMAIRIRTLVQLPQPCGENLA